jgi:hypothetical protein
VTDTGESHDTTGCLLTRGAFLRRSLAGALAAPFLAVESIQAAEAQSSAPGRPGQPYAVNVRDFGAKGNGVDKDHPAIQRAIDRCAELGGGTVWVPAGRYLCGTIVLKSHIRLFLDAGAVILGSPDPEDYRRMMEGNHFYRSTPTQPVNQDQNLICVWKATDVGIDGPGEIDAQGLSFYQTDQPPVKNGSRMSFLVKPWRPGAAVAFMHCRRFSLSGITLRNTPFLGVLLFGSSEGRVHGVQILGDHRFRTCDGIHTKASRDITISDCHIDSEDDCLSFYTNSWGLPDDGPDTSNVAVTNCVLSSSCSGVRIGYASSGHLSNLVFSNIVVKKANRGIDFICIANNIYQGRVCPPGPSLHNLMFSNFVIQEANWGISGNLYSDTERPACIRDVRYEGMQVRSRRGNYLVGSKTIPLENITFRDVDFTVTGELAKASDPIPDPLNIFGAASIPHAFFLRHAQEVAMRDCRIRWDGAQGDWRSGIHVVDGKAIDCRTLRVDRLRKDWTSGITSASSEVAMPRASE